MINPNDVAKALRLIAEEIESKSYDAIRCQSVTCHIEYGVIIDVTMRQQPVYDISLQFNTDLLKRDLTYNNMRNTMSVSEFYDAVLDGIENDRN